MKRAFDLVKPTVLWSLCIFVCTLHESTLSFVDAAETNSPDQLFEQSTIEIPFAYPDRPTVYAEIGGVVVPLLFDTGTNCSILLDTGENSLPPGLVFSENQENLAQLDGKPIEWVQSGYLRYARSNEVVLGNSPPLDIKFRVYKAEPNPDRDFQGALSPLALAETHIIQVLNSVSQLHLTPRNRWVPAEHAFELPLKVTKEGIFLRLWIENQAFWFQLDTGFSGEIAVTPESNLGFESILGTITQQTFEGWGGTFDLTPWSLDDLNVSFLYNDSPGETIGISKCFSSYLLPEVFLQETTSFEVAGIIGAAFLMKFDLAMDLSAQTIYLGPKLDNAFGNPWPTLPGYRNK